MDRQTFCDLILTSIPKRLITDEVKYGLLTHEQAREYVNTHRCIYSTAVRLEDGTSAFFTPNWYLLGAFKPKDPMNRNSERLLGPEWVPSSTVIPHQVKPREGLHNGVVDSFDDFLFIYHHNDRYIQTIDELYDFVYGEVTA